MQLQELNALLTETDQFAISPTAIDRMIPYGHEQSKTRKGTPTCPLGLIRATVLESKHSWIERVAFGCAGKTHPVERTTGVLVRVKRADLEDEAGAARLLASSAYVTETVDDAAVIQLVVSRKAITMPWADYQPVRDARRKSQREADRRQTRLDATVQALGAESGSWSSSWDKARQTSTHKAEDAEITLSLPRAEALVAQLREHGLLPDLAAVHG
jgi:hypothetical protein